MSRFQIIGAIRLPAMLFLWTAGVVLYMSHQHQADAAMVRAAAPGVLVLAEVPSITNGAALAHALDVAMTGTEVASGRWQPSAAATIATAEPQSAPPGSEAPWLEARPAAIESSPTVIAAPREVQPSGPHAVTVADAGVADVAPSVAGQPEPDRASGSFSKAPSGIAGQARTELAEQVKRQARAALRANGTRRAYALLLAGIAGARNDAEYLGLLAVATLAEQRFAEARVVYEKLVLLQPDNDRWWAGLALTQKRLGESAEGSYRQMLKLARADSELVRLARWEFRST